MVCCLLSEWCVATSFYQRTAYLVFFICATYCTLSRGKAYKALLDAKNRQGYRSDRDNETSGENRQKYSARALVAEFFGVTEYEIRKAVKLTQLIPTEINFCKRDKKELY